MSLLAKYLLTLIIKKSFCFFIYEYSIHAYYYFGVIICVFERTVRLCLFCELIYSSLHVCVMFMCTIGWALFNDNKFDYLPCDKLLWKIKPRRKDIRFLILSVLFVVWEPVDLNSTTVDTDILLYKYFILLGVFCLSLVFLCYWWALWVCLVFYVTGERFKFV